MRILKIALMASLASSLSACAVGEKKAEATAKLNSSTQNIIEYLSERKQNLPNPDECPASDKSWVRESTRALVGLANACARLGKYSKVEQMGNLLAERDSQLPWGAFYLSLAAEGRKEYARALWMIDLAMKKSPQMALLSYQKGRIHWSLEEHALAAQDFNDAIKLDPKMVDAHLFLAQLYFRNQDYKKSAEQFSFVVKIEPDNALALVGLADTKMQMGDGNATVRLYEQAVEQSPRNLNYRIKLAGLYEAVQKNYELALTTYRRVKELMSENRTPAEALSVDVNEKIRRLEALVVKPGEKSKKVSETDVAPKSKIKK